MLLNKSLKKAVDDDKSKLAKDDLKKDREHVNARACEQAVYLTNYLISVTKLWLKGGMKEDNALSAAVVKALNGNKEEICLAVRRTLPPGNSIPEQAIDNVYAMLIRIVKPIWKNKTNYQGIAQMLQSAGIGRPSEGAVNICLAQHSKSNCVVS
jgi:hypothetical protein